MVSTLTSGLFDDSGSGFPQFGLGLGVTSGLHYIRFELSGSGSSLAWNGERPDELWIGHRNRRNELLLRDTALLSPAAAQMSRIPGGHAEGHRLWDARHPGRPPILLVWAARCILQPSMIGLGSVRSL